MQNVMIFVGDISTLKYILLLNTSAIPAKIRKLVALLSWVPSTS